MSEAELSFKARQAEEFVRAKRAVAAGMEGAALEASAAKRMLASVASDDADTIARETLKARLTLAQEQEQELGVLREAAAAAAEAAAEAGEAAAVAKAAAAEEAAKATAIDEAANPELEGALGWLKLHIEHVPGKTAERSSCWCNHFDSNSGYHVLSSAANRCSTFARRVLRRWTSLGQLAKGWAVRGGFLLLFPMVTF